MTACTDRTFMFRPFLFLLTAGLAIGATGIRSASAEGALAIGLPDNVAQDGVAFGYSANFETREKAIAVALEHCRTTKESTAKARSLCQVVEAFRGQCVAISMDPKAGTPGVGWAVAPGKSEADGKALTACKATAGADRQGACVISVSVCDRGR
jgi:hypothetical protein